MLTAQHERALGRLESAARRDSVPDIDPQALDQMVDHAMLAAEGRRKTRSRQARGYTVGIVAVAACIAIAVVSPSNWLGPGPSQLKMGDNAARFEMPTGDRIYTTPSVVFEITSMSATSRRFLLREGSMLYDVAPLRSDEHFEVCTQHLCASVEGTVFGVTVSPTLSRVHVFEGLVEVQQDGMRFEIGASETYDSQARGEARGWSSPLSKEGRFATKRRRRVAPRKDADSPVSTQSKNDEQLRVDPSPPRPATEGRPTARPVTNRGQSVPLATAREWILVGRSEDAIRAARTARANGEDQGDWWMLEADAERARDNSEAAARAYDEAASHLSQSPATHAGYLAARAHYGLDHFNAALRSLERSRAAESGSPVEERALVLSIQILTRVDRHEEAHRAARRYVARFPAGASRRWTENLLQGAATSETSQ